MAEQTNRETPLASEEEEQEEEGLSDAEIVELDKGMDDGEQVDAAVNVQLDGETVTADAAEGTGDDKLTAGFETIQEVSEEPSTVLTGSGVINDGDQLAVAASEDHVDVLEQQSDLTLSSSSSEDLVAAVDFPSHPDSPVHGEHVAFASDHSLVQVVDQLATYAPVDQTDVMEESEMDIQISVGSFTFPLDQDEIRVKFWEADTYQVATTRCRLSLTIVELRKRVADQLKIPCSVIQIHHRGVVLEDYYRLDRLELEAEGILLLELVSTDPAVYPIYEFRLPDEERYSADSYFISVNVTDDFQGLAVRKVTVEIVRPTTRKRFLGGYRHRLKDTVHHHAFTQTLPQRSPIDRRSFMSTRSTQTYALRHLRQQTTETTSTQMTGVGVYIPDLTDKLLEPRRYVCADDILAIRTSQAVAVQKYVRRMLAKCHADQLRLRVRCQRERDRLRVVMKEVGIERRLQRDFQRRLNPRTKDDFELLYNAMEEWRLKELSRIDETLTGAERKLALTQLLDEEAELISCIARRRYDVIEDIKKMSIKTFLKKCSLKKIWYSSDGLSTSVETPATARAGQLQEMYNVLQNEMFDQDERIDVLMTIKNTVKEDKCQLTADLIQLIDREANLLCHGFSKKNLEGLRKRISHHFLQYIRTPAYNPEVVNLLKVPQDPMDLKGEVHLCSCCKRFLKSGNFHKKCSDVRLSICDDCERLRNKAGPRYNQTPFKAMLKEIRQSEDSFNDGSQVAFVIRSVDIKHLVMRIWYGKSLLSENSDLFNLVLVRWDKYQQWSPWNTILLTRDEAEAHARLENINQDYEPSFLHEVRSRHARSRVFFRDLPGILQRMPLTCDPDPAALDALLTVHKSVRKSRLRPMPCTAAPWPVKVHHHLRRPANL